MSVNKKETVCRALALVYVTLLNALVIARYWHQLSHLNDNYRKLVLGTFHISGFDPLSYIVIDHCTTAYNIYRNQFPNTLIANRFGHTVDASLLEIENPQEYRQAPKVSF